MESGFAKGLYFSSSSLVLKTFPIPQIREDEALVKVLIAGICSTDLHLMDGYYDFNGMLGHEFVGLVEQCFETSWIGKRVVGEINLVCKGCEECLASNFSHCLNRSVLGIKNCSFGAFSSHIVLPISNLYVVDEEISNERAVFVEPLAAALEIQEQVKVFEGCSILVVGAGKLGQLVARTLAVSEGVVHCLCR